MPLSTASFNYFLKFKMAAVCILELLHHHPRPPTKLFVGPHLQFKFYTNLMYSFEDMGI